MISIGIIHLDPFDAHLTKGIIKGSNASLIRTKISRSPDSVIIFFAKKPTFDRVIERVSEEIISISRISEIRNIRASVIDAINPEPFGLPQNIDTGIFESNNLEVIISSANAISMVDDVTIIQLVLSGNSATNSRMIIAGNRENINKSIDTAISINRSAGQVIEKYEKDIKNQ